MIRFFVKCFALLTLNSLFSQNVLTEQYFLNNYLLNPAVSGIEEFVDVQLGHRWQWTGLEGAPKTTYLSIHAPVGAGKVFPGFSRYESGKYLDYNVQKRSVRGVGGYLLSDKIGAFSTYEVGVSLANHLPLTKDSYLSFGASPSVSIVSLDQDFLSNGLSADPTIAGFGNQIEVNLKFGLWYYRKNLYAGVSSFHYGVSGVDDVFITGGYRWNSMLSDWDLIPFGIARYARGEVNIDVGLKASWKQRMLLGGLLRSNKSVTGFFGFNLNTALSFTYFYNTIPAAGERSIGASTHEVNLHFRMKNSDGVLCPQMMW